ncbi:hypothetical protein PV328_004528 [Microctonus aethiopoides]|uniref:Uncharacterized protein n=1 Tax=Microctonus aethiopoides TaxID=144406 RepID=A0AA39FAP7_9HYME|nr:hypothetical protein PV328_004528 [Microctonus aethiopoides]
MDTLKETTELITNREFGISKKEGQTAPRQKSEGGGVESATTDFEEAQLRLGAQPGVATTVRRGNEDSGGGRQEKNHNGGYDWRQKQVATKANWLVVAFIGANELVSPCQIIQLNTGRLRRKRRRRSLLL